MLQLTRDVLTVFAFFWIISVESEIKRHSCVLDGGQWAIKSTHLWGALNMRECRKS